MSYFDILPTEVTYKIIDDDTIITNFLRTYPQLAGVLIKTYIFKYGEIMKKDLMQISNDLNLSWDTIMTSQLTSKCIGAERWLDFWYTQRVGHLCSIMKNDPSHFKTSRGIHVVEDKNDDVIRGVIIICREYHNLYKLIVSKKFHIKYGIDIFEYLCMNITTNNVKNILFSTTLSHEDVLQILECEDVRF